MTETDKTTKTSWLGRIAQLIFGVCVVALIFIIGVSTGIGIERNRVPNQASAPSTAGMAGVANATMTIAATPGGTSVSITEDPELTNTPLSTDTPEPPPTPAKTLADIKDESVLIEYKDLFRNIETHTGKVLHASGQIVQVAKQKTVVIFGDDIEQTVLRVNITKDEFGNYTDTVWLEYHGTERFLEEDVIEFWATVDGLQEYESVMGSQVELPRLTVNAIELLQE